MASSLAAETVVQTTANVVRIKGSARYKVGSGAWQTLKRGDQLGGGTIIETAVDSQVDLVLGEGEPPVARPVAGEMLTYRPTAAQNMVRIWQNSRLALDKLTRTETGAGTETETQLDLQAGHILGTVKKMSAASKYEVKIPNGVAGIRGTTYEFNLEEHLAKCMAGAIHLAWVDPATGKSYTQEIQADQVFNWLTGVLRAILDIEKTFMIHAVQQMILELQAAAPLVFAPDKTLILVSPH